MLSSTSMGYENPFRKLFHAHYLPVLYIIVTHNFDTVMY